MPVLDVDERDRPRRLRAVLPQRRVVVRRAVDGAVAVAPGLGLVRVRRRARVDHHEAVAAAPVPGPVDPVEFAGVRVGPVDLPDVVLVLRLQDRAGLGRVPRVQDVDGVAGIAARALAAGRVVPAEERLRVGGDPVLGLLTVDEADRCVRRDERAGAAVDAAGRVVALEVLAVPGLGEIAGRRVGLHRVEEALRECRRRVDQLRLPRVLVRDGVRLRVVVVVAPVVDERLGAEERELVAARVLAARDQHAGALEVRDLAEHLRLVELARREADGDDA